MSGLAAWAFQVGRSQAHDIAPGYKKEKRKRELNTPKKKTGRPSGSGTKPKEKIATHHTRLSEDTVLKVNRLKSRNDTIDAYINRIVSSQLVDSTITITTTLTNNDMTASIGNEEERRIFKKFTKGLNFSQFIELSSTVSDGVDRLFAIQKRQANYIADLETENERLRSRYWLGRCCCYDYASAARPRPNQS